MLQRVILTAFFASAFGSTVLADGKIPTTGYTTLQPQPTVTQTVSAPQYFVVPGLISVNCCCSTNQVTFIPGVVLTTPSVTTHTWGSNG